jgi:outer membrane receptor for ferrienterochelin and colicins
MLKKLFIIPLTLGRLLAQSDSASMNEVVITGTMRPVLRQNSPVPVAVLQRSFFRSNPGAHLFESVQMVNGLQPQVNCNVCSAGDIHINGMEGAYTLVTIDGMPLVSSLGTVYGLMGLPNSLLERVEIIKGAASALYGPEAMAGVINLITRNPQRRNQVHADLNSTSHGEHALDLAGLYRWGKVNMISSLHGFLMNQPFDNNGDGFTDIPVQERFSFFQKMSINRNSKLPASLAVRRFEEYRWGGQMHWEERFAGTDSVYGERIRTTRNELLGAYQLAWFGKPLIQWSATEHRQNSVYGIMPFQAVQRVGFLQFLWSGNHRGISWLAGLPLRYTFYDDQTVATPTADRRFLPGFFVQAEGKVKANIGYNVSIRMDDDRVHGTVWSPRLALRCQTSTASSLRFNLGTGYRLVQVFTEDHAALTGAREVVFQEALRPERSWSALLNYAVTGNPGRHVLRSEATVFYTRFSNKIAADYFSNPNQIIYSNLNGFARSTGLSLDFELFTATKQRISLGITAMQVGMMRRDSNGLMDFEWQVHSPPLSASLQVQQPFPRNWMVDIGAKMYSPMRLPVVPGDFRPAYSPWYALLNIQATKKSKRGFEFYVGIRNLFNFVPVHPLLRPFDPFDKFVHLNNPQGYTFDAAYNYASLQGRRIYVGIRMQR